MFEYCKYDFSFLGNSTKSAIIHGYNIVSKIDNAWEFLKNFDSNNNNFISYESEILNNINKELKIPKSDALYELTLRHLEIIAKEGYENYKLKFINNEHSKKINILDKIIYNIENDNDLPALESEIFYGPTGGYNLSQYYNFHYYSSGGYTGYNNIGNYNFYLNTGYTGHTNTNYIGGNTGGYTGYNNNGNYNFYLNTGYTGHTNTNYIGGNTGGYYNTVNHNFSLYEHLYGSDDNKKYGYTGYTGHNGIKNSNSNITINI
jgi:hypothetical protein